MIGPYKFSVKQLEKAGVIVNSSTIANPYVIYFYFPCFLLFPFFSSNQ